MIMPHRRSRRPYRYGRISPVELRKPFLSCKCGGKVALGVIFGAILVVGYFALKSAQESGQTYAGGK